MRHGAALRLNAPSYRVVLRQSVSKQFAGSTARAAVHRLAPKMVPFGMESTLARPRVLERF